MKATKMVLLAVMMVFTGTVFAHGAGCDKGEKGCSDKKGMKGDKCEMMMKALDLDENQKTQIKAIHEANMKKMQGGIKAMIAARKALMEAGESDNVNEATIKDLSKKVADSMAAMVLNRSKMKKEVKALLTDEQKKKFDKIHSEKKARMGKMHKDACGDKKGKKGKKGCGSKKGKGCDKDGKKGCDDCDK